MVDSQAIHDQIRHIRNETDASREVRLSLETIERSLSGMDSAEEPPGKFHDRLKEIRAKLDRLSDSAEGETARELDRLREEVRESERDDADVRESEDEGT